MFKRFRQGKSRDEEVRTDRVVRVVLCSVLRGSRVCVEQGHTSHLLTDSCCGGYRSKHVTAPD